MADSGAISGGGDGTAPALLASAPHPAAQEIPASMQTPVRPPSISTSASAHSHHTPPGSPMDIDFEARSPAAASPSHHRKHAKKPVISVFDWDDTLCPSSWLFREGLLGGYGLLDDDEPIVTEPSSFGGSSDDELSDTAMNRLPKKRHMGVDDHHVLRVFEEHVLALLQTARQYGPVFIITAAKLQWVRQCAESFLPNVLQVLTKSDSVHVISAREFYASQSRRMASHQSKMAEEGTPLAWKTIAFEAVCAHLRVDDYVRRSRSSSQKSMVPVVVDVVSVGDSLCERDACRFLAMKAPAMIHAKTLKYLDQPKMLELTEQVKMTKGLYEQICRYHGSLDLHVVRSRGSLEVVQLHSSGSASASASPAQASASAPQVQQSIPSAISEEVRARAELQRRSNAAAAVSCSTTSLRREIHEEPKPSGISVSGPRTSL